MTYDLRLWMDENTPAGEETSEASFFSKVTVTTSPTTEENIQNEITSGSESQTPEYNTEKEEVLIHVEGDHGKFNGYYVSDHELSEEEISSISSWKSIVPESNPVDIREVFTESGEYYVYIKDEYGNIEKRPIVIDKVDKSGPEIIEVQTTEEWSSKNTITIKAIDKQSGIIGYQFSSIDEEPREYIEVERSQEEKTFTHEVSENGVYYFFVKDNLGHVTRKEVKVTKADAIKPELTYSIGSSTEGSNGWYKALSLKVTTSDSLSGVQSAKYCVTTEGVCEPSNNAILNNNEYVVSFNNHSNGQKVCSNVTDHVGNISEVKCSEVYKVDNTIPSVTLNGTTNSSVWTKNDSTLTGSVSPSSAPSGYQYQWYQVPEYKHVYVSDRFQLTEKYESNGSKYYNVTLNKTSGTTNDWAHIIFSDYAYTEGHTYRIHFKIRVNSISNMSFEVRHSLVENDCGAERKIITFNQAIDDFREYTIDRVMPSSYMIGDKTYTTLSPRVEIFSSNLALTNDITNRSVNFDFKDVWVEDLTPDSKSTIANNLAVKLNDTGLSKTFTSTINSWYVLQATTNAGNVASSNKYQVLVDKTVSYASLGGAANILDPTLSFTVSVSGNNIVINASGSNLLGITSYQYSRDNANWVSSTSSSYTFTNVPEGKHTVYVRIIDDCGEVHTTSMGVEV